MNLNNPNYLLVDEDFPADYFDEDLRSVANTIMLEFDTLRGGNQYESWIRESGYKQNQENKIVVLAGILQLFNTEPDRALYVIKECGLKYKTAKQVEKALNSRLFDQKVERIKEEAENIIKEKNNEVWTFEDACTLIEENFKGVILDYDITVAKYCSWEKKLKTKIANINKANANRKKV